MATKSCGRSTTDGGFHPGTSRPHLPTNELYQPVSPGARDLRGKQEESLDVSEEGGALSQGTRHDASQHLPEAWAEVSGVSEMPGIVEERNVLGLGECYFDQRSRFCLRPCGY